MVLTDALQHFEMVRSDVHLAEKAVNITPAGRLVNPQDVAGLVAFLCSPDANMIRGQVITMDGGASLLAPGLEILRGSPIA
jgi:enoyl-[acyl-carrier protein] reductase III